jgi:hypothetical protein
LFSFIRHLPLAGNNERAPGMRMVRSVPGYRPPRSLTPRATQLPSGVSDEEEREVNAADQEQINRFSARSIAAPIQCTADAVCAQAS